LQDFQWQLVTEVIGNATGYATPENAFARVLSQGVTNTGYQQNRSRNQLAHHRSW